MQQLAEEDHFSKPTRKCPCSRQRPPKIGEIAGKASKSKANPHRGIEAKEVRKQSERTAVNGSSVKEMVSPPPSMASPPPSMASPPPSKLGFKAAASLCRARARAVEGFKEAGCTVDNIVVKVDVAHIDYCGCVVVRWIRAKR